MYTHSGAGWHIRDFERRDYRPCYQVFRECLREFPWRGPAAPYLRQLFNALPTAMARIAGSSIYAVPYGAFAAATVLGSLPLLLLVLLFQRAIVSGLTQGAVKG